MSKLALTASFTWLCSVTIPLGVSATTMRVEEKVLPTDVCAVLKNPQSFVNHIIRLRGFILLGEDHMNVSDKACPGRGIELVIKSDAVLTQRDVRHFYTQMNHQGRIGVATLTGRFTSDADPLTPYVLNIKNVEDVAPAH